MTARRFVPTREWEDARQLRGLAGEHAALAYLSQIRKALSSRLHSPAVLSLVMMSILIFIIKEPRKLHLQPKPSVEETNSN